jgi:hypothetical protein
MTKSGRKVAKINFEQMPINDEESLPSLSKDFAKNAKKALEERKDRNLLLLKRLGPYGADLAMEILEAYPHLTTQEVIEQVELMT